MIVFDWALDVRGVALRQLSKQAGRWSICRVRCGGIDDHRRWPPTLQLRSGWCVWDSRRLGNMSGPYAAPRDAPCRKHGGPGRAAAGPSRRRRRCQRSQRRSASPTSCTTLGFQARVDERLRPPTKGAGACRGWSEGRRRGGWRCYSVQASARPVWVSSSGSYDVESGGDHAPIPPVRPLSSQAKHSVLYTVYHRIQKMSARRLNGRRGDLHWDPL